MPDVAASVLARLRNVAEETGNDFVLFEIRIVLPISVS